MVVAALLLACVAPPGQPPEPPDETPEPPALTTQPNIVWIIADDIGYDIKAYQNEFARTPTLDKLAREGVQFWRFYTPASVCSPSRVGFSTGQHPAEMGIYTTLQPTAEANAQFNGAPGIQPSVPTLFELLSPHGYRTGHAGKWHRGSITGFGPEDKGIDEIFSYAQPGGRSDDLGGLFRQGPTPFYSQLDARITDFAVDFIDRTAGPFFLEISYHTPHNPLHPPQEYLDQFPHLRGHQAEEHVGLEPPMVTPAQVYYAAIKQLDDNVDRVMDALTAKGIEDDTIVLFTGDNGPGTRRLAATSFNAYGSTGWFRGTKATVYEGGIRVPFIAKGPGFAEGVMLHEAISGTDIVPSLLSVLGIDSGETFYGEDMSTMFYGNDVRRTKPIQWITVQNRAVAEDIANRSPVLAMYDPETDVKCLMQPGGQRKEAYLTGLSFDPAELDNLHRSDPQIPAACFESLGQWFESLPPPKRFRKGAGKLYPNR